MAYKLSVEYVVIEKDSQQQVASEFNNEFEAIQWIMDQEDDFNNYPSYEIKKIFTKKYDW